jgi:hypothetical protein
MTLWFFDTSTRDLVYADPQAPPLKFHIDVCKLFVLGSPDAAELMPHLEADLRKALPRFDRSPILMPTRAPVKGFRR